jgi:hypothetical protein
LTLSNQMLDGELAPEVETESITPGSAQLADPSGASVGAGGVTNCRRSNASTRTYSEPEMGFEPMTCALRGPSKASVCVPPVRNASHRGRSTRVKRGWRRSPATPRDARRRNCWDRISPF